MARDAVLLGTLALIAGALFCSPSHAADFTGSAVETEHVWLGIGIVISFALGWIAGGQR